MEENIDINFDEKQSLKIIRSALASSKHAFLDEGLLLILWGVGLSIGNFWSYYNNTFLTAWWMRNLMTANTVIFGIGLIAFTIYFVFFRRRSVTTFAALSTRFVWIGVLIAANVNVLITRSILQEVNFTMLQPLQMTLIGFALFVTGGIYRCYILVVAGVIMWTAAVICGYYDLTQQHLIRSVSEIICFVIPGFVMLWSKKRVSSNV